jgi:ATP synthase protein I
MKKQPKSPFREMAYYSSLGLSVAFAIFIGLFVGLKIDQYFDTSPIFTLIFLAFGVAASFSNIIRAIKRSQDL